jgi:poly(A)-specific ribonuclease
VHQVLQTDFNNEFYAVSNGFARTMTVQRLTDEVRQQQEDVKVVKPPSLNLRRVLDMISSAGKPLIGHNCFLDLMQIYQQFMWDLPLDLEDWKESLINEWKVYVCGIVMWNLLNSGSLS